MSNLGSNDKIWKSLAAELQSASGLQTRDMTQTEHQWLADTLQAIGNAYDKNDINYARTLSHLVVSEGYRKQELPQHVWIRTVSPGLQNVQQLVNQQNHMLAQMQYQNQMAIQQAMMTPYWNAPTMGMSQMSMGPSPTSYAAYGYASASGPPQVVVNGVPVQPPAYTQPSSFEQPVPKPDLSRSNAVPSREGPARQSSVESESDAQSDASPTPEGKPDTYNGFKIGDSVVRKNQPCTLVDIDFSATPPDAIIKMRNGRQIVTEFEQLSLPKKQTYSGFSEGDKVVRKGKICTLISIDFSMDPPGAMVKTEHGTEVSTEFHLLSKPDEKDEK